MGRKADRQARAERTSHRLSGGELYLNRQEADTSGCKDRQAQARKDRDCKDRWRERSKDRGDKDSVSKLVNFRADDALHAAAKQKAAADGTSLSAVLVTAMQQFAAGQVNRQEAEKPATPSAPAAGPLKPGPAPAQAPDGVRSCQHCGGWLDMRPLKAELARLRAVEADHARCKPEEATTAQTAPPVATDITMQAAASAEAYSAEVAGPPEFG